MTTLSTLHSSLEHQGRFGEELFDQIEQMCEDPTISDLMSRKFDLYFGRQVSQESWRDYPESQIAEGVSSLIEKSAQGIKENARPALKKTSEVIASAAKSSWKGFIDFIETIHAHLDKTAKADLVRTEKMVNQAKGDGSGQFKNKSLAMHLSLKGQLIADIPGCMGDLTSMSQHLIRQVQTVSSNLANVSKALDELNRGQGTPTQFNRMRAVIVSTMEKLPLADQLFSNLKDAQWPGGAPLLKPANDLKQFDRLGVKLKNHFVQARSDISLKDTHPSGSISGTLEVLDRATCLEVCRAVEDFIKFNIDLTKQQSYFEKTAVDGKHLAKLLKLANVMNRNDHDQRNELNAIGEILQTYDYLSPPLVLRRFIQKNHESITHALQYVRESVRYFD